MVLVPTATPVTIPVPPTVATAVLLLVHVPPPVASVSAAVPPRQMLTAPVGMIGDAAFTVTIVVALQPVEAMQVIVAVPVATPVTMPDVAPIVATDVLLLLQLPVPNVLLSVVVPPAHTVLVPEMVGSGVTVTIAVTKQPPIEYVIIAVPAVFPVTEPPEDTVALSELLVHVPPPTVSAKPVVDPTHTLSNPVIADGFGLTVNVIVVLLVPTV